MEDQYIPVVKRFMNLAARSAYAFPVVPTEITELMQDDEKLFHLDIKEGGSLSKVESDRVIKVFQGGNITIGYNENFTFKNPIRKKFFNNYELKDKGDVSYIALSTSGTDYETGLQNALLQCYYNTDESEDTNNVVIAFDEEKIRYVFGRTFPSSGRLDVKRELTEDDPKQLHRLIDDFEPFIDHIVKPKPREIELPRLFLTYSE